MPNVGNTSKSGFIHAPKHGAGFTLIELLIVIAIIGILSSIVIVAVNPFQQIARAKDSNRISDIVQLALSLESYVSRQNGTPPTPGNTWMDALIAGRDLRSEPD